MMKQKRAGEWGYFLAGVAELARNRMLVAHALREVHPASVQFSALVQIVGCMQVVLLNQAAILCIQIVEMTLNFKG